MKIRITKGEGWYEDNVGEEFDVIRTQTNRRGKKEFIVWEGEDGNYNWVDEDNCKVMWE